MLDPEVGKWMLCLGTRSRLIFSIYKPERMLPKLFSACIVSRFSKNLNTSVYALGLSRARKAVSTDASSEKSAMFRMLSQLGFRRDITVPITQM